MAAWICSGVVSCVAGFGEGGGDWYLGGRVGFVRGIAEGDPPGEEIGTGKWGAGVDVN